MPETESIRSRDGTPLLVRRWPPAGEPWATALIVHGLGEHSGRWDRVAVQMAAAGIAVQSFDQRGHGASGGPRAHVERFDDLLVDVEDRLAASRRPGLPGILYGHSMGGLVAADYLLSGRPAPDLAVLTDPALGDRVSPLARSAVLLLSRVLPRARLSNPFTADQLSRDPAVAAAYAGDPLVISRTSVRLGAEIFGAGDRVRRKLAAGSVFPCPTLVIHGGDDTVIPPASTERLADLPGVERRLLPGVRHEPHNDPHGAAIVGDIIAWLRARVYGEPG